MKNIIAYCRYCQSEFQKAQDSNRTCCSVECRRDLAASKRKIRPINHCKQCQKEIAYDLKFCSRSCSATYNNSRRIRTEEFRNKISQWAKQNPRGAVTVPYALRKQATKPLKRVNSLCLECSAQLSYRPSEPRKYCSWACKLKNNFHPNSTIVHKSTYEGFKLDSGAELVFAQELNKHQIRWLKNDGIQFIRKFQYIKTNGKIGYYYPDFYLPDYDLWVEIKGRKYQNENDDLKLKCVGNIEMLISNEFKQNLPLFFSKLAALRGN